MPLNQIILGSGGVLDTAIKYKQQKDQQTFEKELARNRAEIEKTRAKAEADSQSRALFSQMSISEDVKKWLGWAIAGLGLTSSIVGLAMFFRSRRAK